MRPDGGTCLDARLHFNPRTPCGVRQLCRRLGRVARHFNPRTPCGVRPKHIASSFRVDHRFQSTHPVWGATVNARASQSCLDISIHAPRVGCDGSRHKIHHIEWSISIHAPRVGCDGRGGGIHQGAGISIHAPRVGCDDRSCDHHLTQHRFQSTHPVWGATPVQHSSVHGLTISIHAPRVGCDRACKRRPADGKVISIHAPRVGCDGLILDPFSVNRNFNPRTPCGVRPPGISIPPRVTTDFNPRTPCGVRPLASVFSSTVEHFNPRTPCGVRRYDTYAKMHRYKFQSTHPVWGATVSCCGVCPILARYFNPRTPCGVRPTTRSPTPGAS